MSLRVIIITTLVLCWLQSSLGDGTNTNEVDAINLLERFDAEAQVEYYNSAEASWTYNTNITDYNQQKSVEASLRVANFSKHFQLLAKEFDRTSFSVDTNRKLEALLYIGDAALDDQEKLEELTNTRASLRTRYSTGKVCKEDTGECYELEPGLTRIMSTSRDYDELLWAWQSWRDEVGPSAKDDYIRYVELKNEAAKANDQPDSGAYWRSWYETADFEEQMERLYDELGPLYLQLHAYVRRKLYEHYGPDKIDITGPIPAHILGNMWAQTWGNIIDLCIPYPDVPSIDITEALLEQDYTALRMFKASEEFFTSLGLIEMPEEFWNKSMIEKPTDGRSVVCHASAWDFSNGKDFRIKQCTDVTTDDFSTVHHEMGHIEYFLQYKDQPIVYRGGANPGFHEAVGDVLALSVTTPKHLYAVGLLPELLDDPKVDLNYLMITALEKIAFLPFGYLMDQWRWSVFRGDTPPEEYNTKWWELRLKYQGLVPPVERTEDDFDPAAKYHIPASTPYIRYFVSRILQFQFHEALCNASGHTGPLHKCDIYESLEAGTKLANMLKLGTSKPWPDALEAIVGSRDMSALPLINYFKPLIDWLDEQNRANGDVLGWAAAGSNTDEDQALELLDQFNEEAQVEYSAASEAAWTYYTNITEYNQLKSVEADLHTAAFDKRWQRTFAQFDRTSFTYDTNRQIEKLLYIGDAALEDQEKLTEITNVKASLETRYSVGEVCKSENDCYQLEPGLTRIMQSSRDYDELLWAWESWRDAVGPSAKNDYIKYVELKNEAALANDQPDCGAYWRSWYEVSDLEDQVERLYNELRPLYVQLHAYVRRKLYDVYGDKIDLRGPIPAHLFGNMWAQSWGNIFDLVAPYPNAPSIDITDALVDQEYTPVKMFETSEEFFTSLGLIGMPDEFWEKSMLEKPDDGRDVVCHASAWDFYNGIDFRIKQCTDITTDDFGTVHHEMGHIEYYLQYKDLPVVYRRGANPGFHEAVGDVLALSVTTPKHLYAVGLLPELLDDDETDLNYLMLTALEKIAFLPFGYLMDQWRWSVFRGDTPPEEYNTKWWELRTKYQGVKPPVKRSSTDFDPAAKYHIPSGTPYIRYFVSSILQYQFHEALCDAAGHTGPLHKCDIYQSTEAGTKLGDMLKLGSSRPWPEALEAITGSRDMSAEPLIEFFKPLIDWLEVQNEMNGDVVGWEDDNPGSAVSYGGSWIVLLLCTLLALFN
ncbi:angiotensin-converting enzyme-like [Apostichopus japonicus]|uniref:angiotensin-converting enzyme-like n=1 Tax=Stichopus japonicus TaxID=307972 RepID=UPI003AB109E3